MDSESLIHTIAAMLPAIGGVRVEHILAWVTLAMTCLAFLGWALDRAVPALRAQAAKTKTDADDRFVSWLEKVAAVLALVNAFLPAPRFGGRDAK